MSTITVKHAAESYLLNANLSKSPSTVDAQRSDLNLLCAFLDSKRVRRASSIKQDHIVQHLSEQKRAGKSEATIRRYFMTIRAFTRYLRTQGLQTNDLCESLPIPSLNRKLPPVPTVQELEGILDSVDVDGSQGTRDRAVLELLYSSGLRVSELCNLKLEDFGIDRVTVHMSKRGKSRTIPITKQCSEWIQIYLECEREARIPKHAHLLFLTEKGCPLTPILVSRLIKRMTAKAGVKKHLTPHSLRHACATHLLDEGADLRLIQEVLGHQTIASTQFYTHMSSSKMQEKFQQFHPRG